MEKIYETVKVFRQYVAIFINLQPTSSHLHSLQVENSRLVVDEDDNGKFRPEKLNSGSVPEYNLHS